MAEHTELPWRASGAIMDGFRPVMASGGGIVCLVSTLGPNAAKDTDFIVRAVNSHYQLAEALEECVAVLTADTVGTIRMDDPNWYAALDKAVTKARAALTAAKGTDT